MKFIHLGDLHLGKNLYDYSLLDDQKYMLGCITEYCIKNSIDSVLIAGDVYDKAVPSEDAVHLLDEFLRTLSEKNIRVYIVSGNHDSDERLNFGSSFFENHNIYISAGYNGKIKKHTLDDEFGKINVYMLPYIKASAVRKLFPEDEINSYDDAFRIIMENENINTEERNIILAHQFVAGSSDPEISGSECRAVLNVGDVEKISSIRFADFDYTALGHIHSSQIIGSDKIQYSGSLLKYSEKDKDKRFPVVTVNEKGNMKIEYAEIKPKRDVRILKGKLKQLLDQNNITDPDDYIYMILTDEVPEPNVMGIVQNYYPNTLHIKYENSSTVQAEHIDTDAVTEFKSFEELLSDFYNQIYGSDITDEEMSFMQEIAKEAGVTDETD